MSVSAQSPWQMHVAKIQAITQETPGVATYELGVQPDVSYSFQPGQFNMLYLPGVGEVAISVSSDPAEAHRLLHTIRIVGNVTRAISRLNVGDALGVRGPFGAAWPVDAIRGNDVIVAAGGLGLAPLRPVIYHLIRHRGDYGRVTLLYGARTPADLLYPNEYDTWRQAGIDVQLTVDVGSPDWRDSIGFVTTLLSRLQLDSSNTSVFTCGPEPMMRFIAMGALNRAVPAYRIFLSLERNMNCAIGLCGHCQFGPAFVCKDGPVFPYVRVNQLLLVENL